MSIHWIAAETDDVAAILEAVDYAITHDVRGAPPASERPVATDTTDRYLDESVALAEATWAVDAARIVPSHRPLVGALFGLVQRLTHRLNGSVSESTGFCHRNITIGWSARASRLRRRRPA